ncbi:hypothetical protein LIER_33918 [Lithospermum erythrorhizon]|uniref:Uncharacterized protein n=1 Tax=Lithospermum erythrorhizon TaxID=34254 RepID=A0AAV3S174_LITER
MDDSQSTPPNEDDVGDSNSNAEFPNIQEEETGRRKDSVGGEKETDAAEVYSLHAEVEEVVGDLNDGLEGSSVGMEDNIGGPNVVGPVQRPGGETNQSLLEAFELFEV